MEWFMSVVRYMWPCKSKLVVMILTVVTSVLLAVDMLVVLSRHASHVFILTLVVHFTHVVSIYVATKVMVVNKVGVLV